jgi:hypothetical protein
MAANLAASHQGSQPPPVPQAPPSWWGLTPGTWTAQPQPTPVTWNVVTTSPWDDWQNPGSYWDSNSWNRTWDNWNWNNRIWNSWDSNDANWWQTGQQEDQEFQEYLAFKYGKGKGKRPQAFPMAGGAPPQYSGGTAPVTPPYQGPSHQQGPPAQQQATQGLDGSSTGQASGTIPGHGATPTGVLHGSVAGALNQGNVPKTPPPALHSGTKAAAPHLTQEDEIRWRNWMDQQAAAQAAGAATQDTAAPGANTQGDDNRNNTRNARSQPAAERRSSTGRDLPTIKLQLMRNKDFMDSAHKEIDKTIGHYTITDYIKEEVRNLDQFLEAYPVQHNIRDEELEYLENEWANCLLRQMLHLYQGIFRASGNRWDLHRAALPISLDGRLVHPDDHYVINANPKEKNPPCPIQLPEMHEVNRQMKDDLPPGVIFPLSRCN